LIKFESKSTVMSVYHILNGDNLAFQLRETSINQNLIICRECLMDGDLLRENLEEFFVLRAHYIADTFSESEEGYFEKAVPEFEKMISIPDDSEVCLWFENDLFCQANMWFVLWLLAGKTGIRLYRVFPVIKDHADTWKGFGISTPQMLEDAFASKVPFRNEDVQLGVALWDAFRNDDFNLLQELSKTSSGCFKHLEAVCKAHVDRFPKGNSLGRPEQVVQELIKKGAPDFEHLFSEFSSREGIYGFGDLQLKVLYDRQMSEKS
jgi:hypothetical protein